MNEGLNSEEIEDRFFVRGRMEVLNILNDLVYRCEPVTVTFNNGSDIFKTTLLEAKDSVLIFELSHDVDVIQRLLSSPSCAFVAHPDGIRVQFSGGQVSKIFWDDIDAFSVPLPEQVARLQRQKSFRIILPTDTSWAVALFSGDGDSLGKWPLHNLSVGGLGVAVNDLWRLGSGQTIARACLLLPDYGEIDCAVTLRHKTGRAEDKIISAGRIGLEFVNLPSEIGVAIQRYIIRIEHERRGLLTSDDADDYS